MYFYHVWQNVILWITSVLLFDQKASVRTLTVTFIKKIATGYEYLTLPGSRACKPSGLRSWGTPDIPVACTTDIAVALVGVAVVDAFRFDIDVNWLAGAKGFSLFSVPSLDPPLELVSEMVGFGAILSPPSPLLWTVLCSALEAFSASDLAADGASTLDAGNDLVGRGLSLLRERLFWCFELSGVGLTLAGTGGTWGLWGTWRLRSKISKKIKLLVIII